MLTITYTDHSNTVHTLTNLPTERAKALLRRYKKRGYTVSMDDCTSTCENDCCEVLWKPSVDAI